MSYKGFDKVMLKSPKRSTFDLSHDKRLTAQMGYLYPVLCQECVPSDHFEGSTEMLVRLAPLLAPVYDQIQVYVHFFFVPHRLLWDEWERFITGGENGPNHQEPLEVEPVVPQINVFEILAFDPTYFQKSGLADYLGVPLLDDLPNAPDPVDWTNVFLDTMPFVAYTRIWTDYYRDRNFNPDIDVIYPVESGTVPTLDVPTFVANYMLLRSRAYRHDYFRSALPWAQRGDQVMIPSTVNYLDVSRYIRDDTDAPVAVGAALSIRTTVAGDMSFASSNVGARVENIDTIGPLVNDFRSAVALQVWLERNAIAGSRYTESIQAHFDVRPQDSRLQRAEYIGGGMVPVKISEQVSTAWANDGTSDVPQGNLAGHGVAFGNTNQFKWFCAEHGYIFGIMSIINPPSYHQGLPRMFRRRSFLDYPWPTFAKLGEQEVYDFEIYAASPNWEGDDPAEWPVFGYQSRYADWKSALNRNHGDFHDTLLFWTLTSDYGITPVLSSPFVEFDPNIEDRIFAVPSVDNFWIYLHNRVFARRPLPYFGTPNNLGFE